MPSLPAVPARLPAEATYSQLAPLLHYMCIHAATCASGGWSGSSNLPTGGGPSGRRTYPPVQRADRRQWRAKAVAGEDVRRPEHWTDMLFLPPTCACWADVVGRERLSHGN